MENTKYIALVDEADQIIGFEEKMKVHVEGLLHRAFSIFIFNSKGEMLVQKRAKEKYHSGGLWTNTCCSHLSKNEIFEIAIHERLKQEMGFDCELTFAFRFHYRVQFENGLYENEIDHVFTGTFDGTPVPDPEEASGYKWMNLDELHKEIKENPHEFTYWFKIAFDKLNKHLISVKSR